MCRNPPSDREKALSRVARELKQALDGGGKAVPVVTVWGAGASLPCGVPGGGYLMDRMREDLCLVKDTREFRRRIKKAWKASAGTGDVEDKLRRCIDGKDSENVFFEDLQELCGMAFGREGLHRWLRRYVEPGVRTFPSLAHEIASHFAAAGLMDCSISLNFDEILEDALAAEMGYERVQVVASESEFQRLSDLPRNEWNVEFRGQRARCFVLKPHGTISQRLTLCSTSESVRSFPPEKAEALRRALRGAVVVLVGYGSYNEDFRLLLFESFASGDTRDLVIVDPKPDMIQQRIGQPGSMRNVFVFDSTAEEFFGGLAERVYPRPGAGGASLGQHQAPTRHRVRAGFFDLFRRTLHEPEDQDLYRRLHQAFERIPPAWFDVRLYEIELLIHLVKTRGLFGELVTANCPRVDRAYRACLERADNGELEPDDADLRASKVLSRILAQPDSVERVKSWSVPAPQGSGILSTEWCVLQLDQAFPDIGTDKLPEGGDARLDDLLQGVCEDVAERYCKWLREQLRKVLDGEDVALREVESRFYDPDKGAFEINLKFLLSALWQDFDVDVSDRDLAGSMRFEKPRLLRNRTEFAKATKKLLRKEGVDRITLVTASAEWLMREVSQPNPPAWNAAVEVVSNLDLFSTPLGGPIEPDLDLSFHYAQMVRSLWKLLDQIVAKPPKSAAWKLQLRWYVAPHHYHHMVIAWKKGKAVCANYFRRPGRTTMISPVHVDDPVDAKLLGKYFQELRGEDESPGKKSLDAIGGMLFQVKDGQLTIASGKIGDQLIRWLTALWGKDGPPVRRS
jgi:hypothetical protein